MAAEANADAADGNAAAKDADGRGALCQHLKGLTLRFHYVSMRFTCNVLCYSILYYYANHYRFQCHQMIELLPLVTIDLLHFVNY